jgi:hypothetical protein
MEGPQTAGVATFGQSGGGARSRKKVKTCFVQPTPTSLLFCALFTLVMNKLWLALAAGLGWYLLRRNQQTADPATLLPCRSCGRLAFLRPLEEGSSPGRNTWYLPGSLDRYFDRPDRCPHARDERGKCGRYAARRLVAERALRAAQVQRSPTYRAWSAAAQPACNLPVYRRRFLKTGRSSWQPITSTTLRPGTELPRPLRAIRRRRCWAACASGDGYHYGFQDQQLEANCDNAVPAGQSTYELVQDGCVATPHTAQRPAAAAA